MPKYHLLVGALCLISQPTFATMITYNQQAAIPTQTQYVKDVKVDLPGFDASLGKLKSATFSVNAKSYASIDYDARISPDNSKFFAQNSIWYGFIAYSDAEFYDPTTGILDQSFYVPFTHVFDSSFIYTLTSGTFGRYEYNKQSTLTAMATSPSDLAGLSTLPSVQLRFIAGRYAYVEDIGDPGLRVFDTSFRQSADVSVIYNFGVPEPTTWAMMIGGIGLVGGSLRRRRAAIATRRFA